MEHHDSRESAYHQRTRRHPKESADTWILTPAASRRGCGRRTFLRGTRNPSWGAWAAYTAGLRSWWRDHFSCSGGDPAYPTFGRFSFWPDRCEAIWWAVYLGSLPDNVLYRPIGLAPRKVLLVGAWWSTLRPSQRLTRCSSRRHTSPTNR